DDTLPAAAGATDDLGHQQGSFCGHVEGSDVDYWTFTLPSNAHTFNLRQTNSNAAALTITTTANGTAFDMNAATYPPSAFQPGKLYVVKFSSSGPAVDYHFEFKVTCGATGTDACVVN